MFSMKRLEKAKIHTINRFKINEAGRIDMICFDKTGTLTEEFPKTFAYGINFVPYSVKFSKPFEQLICPPLKKSKKIHKISENNEKKFKSDIRNIRSRNISETKNKSNIKLSNHQPKKVFMRRFTNKLSSIGNLYKIDNRDRNTSLGVNNSCLLYTSPSPRDGLLSRMPSSA